MRILRSISAVVLVLATMAAVQVAPAQAIATADYVYVGNVGGYKTYYKPGTCTSGGHSCQALQTNTRTCTGGHVARLGTYDDVFVRFSATTGWNYCAG